jgi:hypothetical protein
MLLPVDDNPSIVRASMCSTVDVVYTGGKSALAWEEGLAKGYDRRVGASGEGAIEIIVTHDFHQPYVAVGHGDAKRKDLVATVRTSVLGARSTDGDAADHYIVDRLGLLRG